MENVRLPEFDAVLLAGPTASGKSGLALDLARQMNGVIVNADSMQIYEPLHIITARPPAADLQKCEHRLYGYVNGTDQYTAARWINKASRSVREIWDQGKTPVLVGGTGLYFSSLLKGLSIVPPIPSRIREAVRAKVEDRGTEVMHVELTKIDPRSALQIKPADPQRIARALEVYETTGKPLSDFQLPDEDNLLFAGKTIRKIILEPDRKTLHQRIETRFDAMVEMGALEEVRALLSLDLPFDRTVLKAIGVPQFTSFLQGECSLGEAVEKSKIATRQYAKRQSTWFRNQMDDSWERIQNAQELTVV